MPRLRMKFRDQNGTVYRATPLAKIDIHSRIKPRNGLLPDHAHHPIREPARRIAVFGYNHSTWTSTYEINVTPMRIAPFRQFSRNGDGKNPAVERDIPLTSFY